MNNYSYESLCKILMKCNIKDAIELDEYITEWNIKDDTQIVEIIDKMKGLYVNDIGQYYKNRIFKYDKYEIVLIYWCPYSHSRVHNHPGGGCIMKILEGYLDIDIYDDSDFSTIQNIGSIMRDAGKIEYMKGKHGIHRISNDNNSEYAISIHIYVYNK
jgi:predicted metal-dependent enzyme (double-stranded beta helix superfamily)